MAVIPPDRVETLLGQSTVTGIDFISVGAGQTRLDVAFWLDPSAVVPPLPGSLAEADVHVTDTESGARLEATIAAWPVVDGREVLRLTVPAPGGFALHRLFIDDDRIDPYFNDVEFSFKAGCPSDLDCAEPPPLCPPEDAVDFPVDYLARDFASLRRALLDFASRRHPTWPDRLEADVGVMWAELAAATGDELAYLQDRWAREAHWETAVLRRSMRAHARLVDYELDDGAASTTWLDLTVGAAGTVTIPTGTAVRSPGGAAVFEVGRGLHDPRAAYTASDARNELEPHLFDEDDTCLPCRATELHVSDHHAADLVFDDFPPGRPDGTWVLLRTDPADLSVTARALPVRLIEVADDHDPVRNLDITRLRWEEEQATPYELDLTALVVRGNLVPATAGETMPAAEFHAGPAAAGDTSEATVERAGADATVCHRFTLPGSEQRPPAWTAAEGGMRPEVRLEQLDAAGVPLATPAWEWRRSRVGVVSSLPTDAHFTLEDGAWRRVAGYRVLGGEVVERDLAAVDGATLRFGDGEFGAIPADGTRFRATYRLGGGRRDDVAAGVLTDGAALPAGIDAVTNPVPAAGGRDPQPLDDARVEAPDAFRAVTYRAVRPEDYAEAVERLEWVQRAGASLRWTGSWLTLFATPDPAGAVSLTPEHERELGEQLDRFRQAGREAFGRPPRYADLDLDLLVCVAPSAYAGEVKAAVLEALVGRPQPCRGDREGGFLHPDNFSFGTPLYRSALESAVQDVPGVRAVEEVLVRRRGHFDWRPFAELVLHVAPDELVRVAQDPLHPDRGSVRLRMEGGL